MIFTNYPINDKVIRMSNAFNKEKIDELFSRGVGEFIDPDGVFRKKLETNPEKIVIKFGVDPTRPDIHIGHAVVLHKLRQFQDMGCKVIFLIGDFTALIGDPTGKSKVRPEISNIEIGLNMKTYVEQIPKILKIESESNEDKKMDIIKDLNGFTVDSPWFGWMRNSDWFYNVTDITSEGASEFALSPQNEKGELFNTKLNLSIQNEKGQKFDIQPNSFFEKAVVYDSTRMQKLIGKKEIKTVSLVNFIAYLRLISQSQLIERDMFQERIKKGEPLFMHEMIYPVAQGIDSNLISDIYGSCDLEVGGTDQTFNMLIGRTLMKAVKKEPQAVLAFKLLEGIDGKEKMSKSLDNYIGIADEPNDMYGKVMSIPDSSIGNYFELCTTIPMNEVEKIRKGIVNGSIHPKEAKMNLAKQIVGIYHNKDEAEKAEKDFTNTFQKGEIPESVEEIKGEGKLLDILVENKITESTSATRRLFDAGAISDMTENVKLSQKDFVKNNHVYKIGKHKFIKIV